MLRLATLSLVLVASQTAFVFDEADARRGARSSKSSYKPKRTRSYFAYSAPARGGSVYYANCSAARAAGAAPVRRGDPGYAPKLDRDGDGVGCE